MLPAADRSTSPLARIGAKRPARHGPSGSL